ncbi:hypothetical protein [Flaviflexus huanghaiensis]|uniref:hypothetical protein n=1 Tax=Flaviflexus huanghaiensis TaxID=1111473 RepID=UPI0015F79611|nr:hypothetical protein [Flaviflexus huanghaiensis]
MRSATTTGPNILNGHRAPTHPLLPQPAVDWATISVVAFGAWRPYSPVSGLLGFLPLPDPFFIVLALMVVTYLACVEPVKHWFFRSRTDPERNAAAAHAAGTIGWARARRSSRSGCLNVERPSAPLVAQCAGRDPLPNAIVV